MEEKSTADLSPKSSFNRPLVIAVAIVAVVIGGIYFLATKDRTNTENLRPDREFSVSAKPFEFSQKEIRVKKGEVVKINLTVTQGLHDWVVDEFKARTKQLATGESGSVIFVADKTGTFEYYCSVGTHRQMGMVGKLIVE